MPVTVPVTLPVTVPVTVPVTTQDSLGDRDVIFLTARASPPWPLGSRNPLPPWALSRRMKPCTS